MSLRAVRRQLDRINGDMTVTYQNVKQDCDVEDIQMFTFAQTILQCLALKLSEPKGTVRQCMGRDKLKQLHREIYKS